MDNQHILPQSELLKVENQVNISIVHLELLRMVQELRLIADIASH
jgi:hypothetical protein